jgi:hypothetical protein
MQVPIGRKLNLLDRAYSLEESHRLRDVDVNMANVSYTAYNV